MLPRDAHRSWLIEAELVFRLVADLPASGAPFDRARVAAAVASVSAGFEIIDSRYAAYPDVAPLLVLADLQSHGAMVVGSGRPLAGDEDFGAVPVSLAIDGHPVVEQRGGNPAGDVIDLVVKLADHLAAAGRGLSAGAWVTTGSYTGMVALAPGGRATARFAGVGAVSVARGL